MQNRRARRRRELHSRGFAEESGRGEGPLDPHVALAVDLSVDEREVIVAALVEWGGPARATEALAVAMGFASREDFKVERHRLLPLVRDGEPLRPWDWRRVLVATEICFVSDYFGAGWEWETVTGLDDQATLVTLREIQDKLIGIAKRATPPIDDTASSERPPSE